MPDIDRTFGANLPLGLRADYPSAENRRPSESAQAGIWGTSPASCLAGRRFGSDILWQTGRSRSTRSMGQEAGLAEPSPTRFRSHRMFRSHAASALERVVPIGTEHDATLTPSCVPS